MRWNKQIKSNKKEYSAKRGNARNVLYQWAESNDGRISHRSRNGRKSNNETCEDLSLQLSFVPPARTEAHTGTCMDRC
jgi:hypothetical protein